MHYGQMKLKDGRSTEAALWSVSQIREGLVQVVEATNEPLFPDGMVKVSDIESWVVRDRWTAAGESDRDMLDHLREVAESRTP